MNNSLTNSTPTAQIRGARALAAEAYAATEEPRRIINSMIEEILVTGRVTRPDEFSRALANASFADHALAAAKTNLQALVKSAAEKRREQLAELEEIAVEEG
jgi:hypothetical protein